MHPFHVLESRVCNVSLPSKQGDLSWQQLRAAIECARAFHLALLDLAGDEELLQTFFFVRRKPPTRGLPCVAV